MPNVGRRDRRIVAAGSLGGLLLLWVTAGPRVVWAGPPGAAKFDSVLVPLILWLRGRLREQPPPRQPPRNVPPTPHPPTPAWVDVAATVLTVLVLVAAAVVVGLLVRRYLPLLLAWWAARRRRAEASMTPVPDHDELAHRVVADARAQLETLEHGLPRNAIVACWMRLEEAAAQAGLPRREWETSAEFTTRVIRSHLVGTTAIERLAALYREARFSRHPMREGDREAARQALETLHLGLRRATAAAGSRPLPEDRVRS